MTALKMLLILFSKRYEFELVGKEASLKIVVSHIRTYEDLKIKISPRKVIL